MSHIDKAICWESDNSKRQAIREGVHSGGCHEWSIETFELRRKKWVLVSEHKGRCVGGNINIKTPEQLAWEAAKAWVGPGKFVDSF